MTGNNNQPQSPIDGYVFAKNAPLFGIYDGLAGEECGEIASFIAARNASRLSIGKNAAADLEKYCFRTNDRICRYTKKNGLSNMGTTAAMLVFKRNEFILCNIGDSKIFQLSRGTMRQLSCDHVVLSVYGTKPPLLQYLGIPNTELVIRPHIAKGKYNAEDIYLICSDGLTDTLKIDELKAVLEQTEFEKAALTLLGRAIAKGGRDNISMIICKIEYDKRGLF